MSDPEIVKVQRPVFTDDAAQPCLIYDREREREQTTPLARLPAHVRKALDAYPKVYCEALWKGRRWDLGQVVEAQPW